MAQNNEHHHEYELTHGQIRSHVEHRLINFLLGHTADQYIDLGVDDDTGRRSSQLLKLRVSEHHLVFVYQVSFL